MQRIISMFRIPVYLEDDINEALATFVSNETQDYHNARDAELISKFRNNETDIDCLVKKWEKLFKEQVLEYAEQKGTSDEEVFAAAYHRLVHSPALETILQVENSYASTVHHTLKQRDRDIEQLTKRQTDEMEDKVRLLNTFTTEEEINSLAGKHFEAQSMVAGRWGSQIDALCQTQRTEYRTWLMQTLEEQQTNSEFNTPNNSPLTLFPSSEAPSVSPLPPARPSTRLLEESFTIHLGSQLKQMHNIRIVSTDIMQFCKVEQLDNATDTSRRLQTALSLYSMDLCGLVVLADGAPGRATGLTAQLARVAQHSTEYHFPQMDDQLQRIAEDVSAPAESRNAQRVKEQAESPYPDVPSYKKAKEGKNLQTGDIFITKHSNLAEVHILFHLVADESSLRSGDINSRHPAILGLRNILKVACSNDVTTLTLPVLLRHDMSEEMTVAWCAKRAELILKCVKGFMIEMASWGGSELKNIQFLLPAGISEELFQTLAGLLPTIFRLSNPLKFKAKQ